MWSTQPTHKDMDTTFAGLMQYAPRTRAWLSQNHGGPAELSCRSLLLYGGHNPVGVISPMVTPVHPEEGIPQEAFAMISCEVEDVGIFREYVTAGVLPAVIQLLIRTRDEARMSEDPDHMTRAEKAVLAVRNLRRLFMASNTPIAEATEALRTEAPQAFAYAISVVRQAVKHNARRELMGLYTHGDLAGMYTFGVEVIGYPVANPEMVTCTDSPVGMVPDHDPDVAHSILRWVAFVCEEVRATTSV